jgi:hypothetical protein
MQKWVKRDMDVRGERNPFGRLTKRPTHLNPRPLENSSFRVQQKPVERLFHFPVPKKESGLEIEQDLLLDVFSNVAREHVVFILRGRPV